MEGTGKGRLGDWGGGGLGAIFLEAALTEVTAVVDPDDVTVIKNYGMPEALLVVSKGCQVCSQKLIRKIDLLFNTLQKRFLCLLPFYV